jgi:ATP-binding cassette subfamily C protein
MHLMIKFARSYTKQSLMMVLALVSAGIVEGVGLTALLPLLQMAVEVPGAAAADPSASSDIGNLINSALK